MKKMMLLGVLLVGAAAVGTAQESRQEFSVSGIGVAAFDVNGLLVHPMHSTETVGVLGSYRYDLTPRSQLELNYGFSQYTIHYHNVTLPQGQVHAKQQELSGAYVYTRTYHNFNPFLEVGIGAMIFTPILDNGTTVKDTRQNTNIGALFGGGLAYEISPSFDVRVEYRGFALKTPDFGEPLFKTNRYYVVQTPSVGIAYHF
ncbi:MAG: outer membrane beta-barrel protein [Acidobacteriota bacterium]